MEFIIQRFDLQTLKTFEFDYSFTLTFLTFGVYYINLLRGFCNLYINQPPAPQTGNPFQPPQGWLGIGGGNGAGNNNNNFLAFLIAIVVVSTIAVTALTTGYLQQLPVGVDATIRSLNEFVVMYFSHIFSQNSFNLNEFNFLNELIRNYLDIRRPNEYLYFFSEIERLTGYKFHKWSDFEEYLRLSLQQGELLKAPKEENKPGFIFFQPPQLS